MGEDQGRIEDTAQWLAKAKEDLRAARHALTAVPPLHDDAVFHCQQVAEKALKAFLAWHDQPFRKTHSIEELGELCLGIDPDLRPEVDRAAPLSEFAWKYRYPGVAESPSGGETDAALGTAVDLLEAVKSRVPAVTHP